MKKVFLLGVIVGMLALLLVQQYPLYVTTTSASEPRVTYEVAFDATLVDGHGARSYAGHCMKIDLPASEPVSEGLFRAKIASELSGTDPLEAAPGQVFVEIIGYTPIENDE